MSGYIHTDVYPMRNVLVVHDLQHEYHPEFFSPSALEERKRVFGESIRRADRIIAVSEHTRRTVVECFGVEPSRITAAHEAADPRFHPENWNPADLGRVRRKYALDGEPFLFFPANTWPHKNHRAAFQALGRLRDTHGLRPPFVCTGAAKEAQTDLLRLISDLDLAAQVRFIGYCPAGDMPALYRAAAALVFPSYFEGFGIPLVEAMWCGCPVVASNRSSLPEIAGDAGLLVNPDNPDELAAAIARVLSDGELRRGLVDRGLAQARTFTWRRFALEAVRVLRETWEAS
jgi:glycosyltransferase involved in cell wall biosynthesis